MFLRRKREKGFVLLSLLMSLMIIGILANTYMSQTGPDGKTFAQTTQERARNVVMVANTRTAQTQFFMDTEGRRLPPAQLRQKLADLSMRMGGEGRFFADQNMNLHNTALLDEPLFREQFRELPRMR